LSKYVEIGDRDQGLESNKDAVRLTLILTSDAKHLDELRRGYSADSYIAMSAVLLAGNVHN